MVLHLVTIPPTVALLDHVTGLREVGHHAECGALRDPDRRGDVAEADTRVARDAQQDSSMVRQEAPLRHRSDSSHQQLEMGYMNADEAVSGKAVRQPSLSGREPRPSFPGDATPDRAARNGGSAAHAAAPSS